MTEFLLIILIVAPALVIRACRRGPIPHRKTWFDIERSLR